MTKLIVINLILKLESCFGLLSWGKECIANSDCVYNAGCGKVVGRIAAEDIESLKGMLLLPLICRFIIPMENSVRKWLREKE